MTGRTIKWIQYGGLTVLLLALLTWMGIIHQRVNGVVIIDVIKVVNEFDLKKDLEKRVEVKLNEYNDLLDSLQAIHQQQMTGINQDTDTALQSLIVRTQQEAQQVYTVSNNVINEQVWGRLNPLIDAYGKEKNYRLVIGANGMGTVLYNTDVLDKTEELIAYINKRYEGRP